MLGLVLLFCSWFWFSILVLLRADSVLLSFKIFSACDDFLQFPFASTFVVLCVFRYSSVASVLKFLTLILPFLGVPSCPLWLMLLFLVAAVAALVSMPL